MRPTRTLQFTWTAGEVDPRLSARIDVTKYYNAAETMRNVLVMPQGGFRRRPGMRHRASITGDVSGVKLLPFAFNSEQTYAVLLTPATARVFLPDGTLVATVTGCPWNATQAAQMNFAQSADTMLLFHPDLAPQRLRRLGSPTSWGVDPFPLSNIPTFDFGSGLEPVISNTRGWPECGTFHQSRLYLGGLRSRPSTIIASRVADFGNFDRGTGLDDQAFMITIDSDQVNAIHQLRSGNALQIFTGGAEYAITVPPPITPTNVAIPEQTRRGIRRFAPVVEVDGATLFIQRGGAGLRQFIYSDVTAQYQADLLSLLAPHLITGSTHMAIRKGSAQDDADHVLILRDTGQITVLTTLRTQEIAAFTRWETAGTVQSLCALLTGEVFFAVTRAGSLRIETWDDTARFDAATTATGSGITTVSGLTHLASQTVAVMADGIYQGLIAVSGPGGLVLPRAADTVDVGLPFTVEATTLPLEPRDQTGAVIARKTRIAGIGARVLSTGRFEINGLPVVERRIDVDAFDGPLPTYSGDIRRRGFVGWGYRPQVRITQQVPGPLQVVALTTDLILAG